MSMEELEDYGPEPCVAEDGVRRKPQKIATGALMAIAMCSSAFEPTGFLGMMVPTPVKHSHTPFDQPLRFHHAADEAAKAKRERRAAKLRARERK